MREFTLLFSALSLILGCANSSLAQRGAVQIRQDSATITSADSSSVDIASTSATSSPSATGDASSATTTAQPATTKNATSSVASTSSAVHTTMISISTTVLPTASATPTAAPGVDSLPIQPVLSPGLGVAGVLLMGFGIAYTFIGIRQKWLHIFCAVMYLIALAITVLLVYVVNPPVTPAVQGAYLVAAFAPGVIIGAASLIFKEVVEGLGCLLGGFCFSMWLLCLAPGGLIHSNGGRIGLIIAFSAACYMLSFSHYTRTYGLIGCIAFGGATSIVLGIDCFSRAGLKEFWIYNWDLNMAIFPLDTTTYPTTRGIKVESAVIVIIALFGVMSQVKLWNVIKDRRSRREAARRQDEEDREHLEANLGRQIQSTNEREKAHWERVYGSKVAPSSASMVGSTDASTYVPGNNSVPPSVRDLHSSAGPREFGPASSDGMEMHHMPQRRSTHFKHNSREVPSVTATQRDLAEGSSALKQHHRTNTLERLEAGLSEHSNVKAVQNSPPPIEPLPFNVPTASNADHDNNSIHSLTTNGFDFFGNGHITNDNNNTQPSNNDAVSQRLSRDNINHDHKIPHLDDRASSAAATLDELTDDENNDLPRISRPQSPAKQMEAAASAAPKRRRSLSSMDGARPTLAGGLRIPSDSKIENRKSMPSFDDLEKVQKPTDDPLYSPSKNLSDKLELKTNPAAAASSVKPVLLRGASLKREFLPEDQPSVASIYRTNEWAKHQAQAEIPVMDEIAPHSEDAVGVDYSKEAAVPVDMQGLQQTALTGQVPIARSASQASSRNPYFNAMQNASQQSISMQGKTPNDSPPLGHGPIPSIQRSSSQSRLTGMRNGNLTTSFVAQPLIESPVEDNLDAEQQQPYSQPNSSGTLLGRREDILNARKSQTMLPGSTPGQPQNSSSSTLSLHPTASNNARHPPTRQSSAPLLRTNSVYSNFDSPTDQRQSLLPSDSASIRGGYSPNALASGAGFPIYEEPESASALGLTAGQDYDDIPLSQRKQLIRQSSLAVAHNATQPGPLQRSTSRLSTLSQAPAQPPSSRPASQAVYDAHLPRRGPSFTTSTQQQQQSRLANWRSELSADERLSRTPSTLLAQSQDEAMRRLAQERMQRAENEQRRERERSQQQGMLDERMRTGSMLRTHAEVLRRMQQKADAGT